MYYIIYIIYIFPVQTGSDRSCNRKRLTKTGSHQFGLVFLTIWDLKDRSRSRSKALGAKKPDWTGLSNTKTTPSVSRFERGRGGGGVSTVDRKYPLRLVFRAREGVVMVVVLCRQRKHPSVSCFEWGRGGDGVSTEKIPPSVSRFKRGRGWWWCVNKRNTPSISRFERRRGWKQQHDEGTFPLSCCFCW